MFEQNELDYELLRDLPEEKLEQVLTDIGLPLGKKIAKRIQESKYQNTEASVEASDNSNVTDVEIKTSDSRKVNKVSREEQYEEVRLVIIGKTGSGKSATGNTILGIRAFNSTISGDSITRNYSVGSVKRFGRKIVVVDTPGIFNTKENNDKIQEEIHKCICITSPGPHALIFVVNAASRYTEEEQRSVEHFVNYFGKEIYKYIIILFVRKDELDYHGIQLSDHIQNAPLIMQQFIQKCGGRVCAFNNNAKSTEEQDEQVKQLLNKVLKNIERNGGKYYTNDMFEEAEKQIKINEAERLAKEKAEWEKQLQSIRQVIADEYNKKLEQERKNLESVQKNIDELLTKQNKENNKITDLISQIGLYEQMIKEKKRDQQDLKQTLDLMRVKLTKSREASFENACLVEQYKKAIDKSQEEKERLKGEPDIERENLQRKHEENIAFEMKKIRNEIRQNIAKEFEEFKRSYIAEKKESEEKRMKEKQKEENIEALKKNVKAINHSIDVKLDEFKENKTISSCPIS